MTVGNAAGANALSVSLEEQMKLLEVLPLGVKEIVWQAPIPLDLREVVAVVNVYGAEQATALIKNVLREAYPGWEFDQYKPRPKFIHRGSNHVSVDRGKD